ncbi:hypothetical protein PIB30_090290 [Stylosanthes scabra]|uniref:Transmembrane protein n=1 Tax=Stylosanthes scabra TaxID=79078 RepID=A0ABU6UUB4_9FABA|nr:hypothetical protein [Stylosanthes scabra]
MKDESSVEVAMVDGEVARRRKKMWTVMIVGGSVVLGFSYRGWRSLVEHAVVSAVVADLGCGGGGRRKNEERKLEEQERKKLEHSGQRLTPRRRKHQLRT